MRAFSDGPGQGSEFTVSLLLASGAEADAGGDLSGRAMPSMTRTSQRVLVVDDNKDAADTLGMLLKMLGAEVAVAHDGLAALQTVNTHRPTVVFLDLSMPGLDGYEVARRIRRLPEARNTMLVALSGWGQDRDRRQAEAAGFDCHLVKPAEFAAVQALLQTVAARHA